MSILGTSLAMIFGKKTEHVPPQTMIQQPTDVAKTSPAFTDEQGRRILAQLGQNNESLRRRFEGLVTISEEFKNVHVQLEGALSDVTSFIDDYFNIKKNNVDLNEEIRILNSTITSFEQKSLSLHSELNAVANEKNNFALQSANLSLRLERAEGDIISLSNTNNDLMKEIRSSRNYINNLEDDLNKSNALIASLEARTKEADTIRINLLDEKRELKDAITHHENEIEELKNILNETRNDLTKTKGLYAEKTIEITQLQTINIELENKFNESNNNYVIANNELMSLRAKYEISEETLKETRKSGEAKIEALNSRIRLGDELLRQARNELRSMTEKESLLYEKTREAEKASQLLRKANTDIERLQTFAESVLSERDKLTSAIDASIIKLRDKDELNKQAASRISGLESQISRIENLSQTREKKYMEEISSLKDKLAKEQSNTTYYKGIIDFSRKDRLRMEQAIRSLKQYAPSDLKEAADQAVANQFQNMAELKEKLSESEYEKENVIEMGLNKKQQ